MYPSVVVKIDKEFDKETILLFVNDGEFGRERILSLHPRLSSCLDGNRAFCKKNINDYVDEYYELHENEMEVACEVMQEIWDEIALKYFVEVGAIFGDKQFCNELAISAFISISKCGVIGDNLEEFQVWYKTAKDKNEVRRHFAHEILHFYYYRYIGNRGFDKLINDWDAAEIFNVVILSLPQFVKIIGKEDCGYQEHEKYFTKYKKIWQDSDNLDDYLKKSLFEQALRNSRQLT